MVSLENEVLGVTIHPKGAELQRLNHKQHGIDYLWNGDPSFWGKHAPVLFPIVGSLKKGTFVYKGKSYELPRHGFARDREFKLVSSSINEACYELKSDDSTLSCYPFEFLFRIRYHLEGPKLTTCYEVENRGAGKMLFSVGAHPAFNVPLVRGEDYSDYYLEFGQEETALRWRLKHGLLDEPENFLVSAKVVPLSPALFYEDAIVLKHLRSKSLSLKSVIHDHGLRVSWEDCPFLGIWAAKDAPFVCIEPWCGITDSVDDDQHLEHKEGIISLAPSAVWTNRWCIECW